MIKSKMQAQSAAVAFGIGLFILPSLGQACTSDPVMGSICIMAFSPNRFQSFNNSYVLAAGQTVSINQNTALFSLIGTTFGGDGVSTFRLPDLRGRVIVGYDASAGNYGSTGGSSTLQLTVAQLPPHAVTFANAGVNISGITANTTLSGLAASANLAGVRISGDASGLVINASTSGGAASPNGMYLGRSPSSPANIYSNVAPTARLNAGSISGNIALTVDPGVTAPVAISGNVSTTIGGSASVSGTSNIVGSGASIPIMPPYLALPYYIAIQGIYPSSD